MGNDKSDLGFAIKMDK